MTPGDDGLTPSPAPADKDEDISAYKTPDRNIKITPEYSQAAAILDKSANEKSRRKRKKRTPGKPLLHPGSTAKKTAKKSKITVHSLSTSQIKAVNDSDSDYASDGFD